MREEGRSGASSRIRKAARKMILAAANACGSFSRKKAIVDPIVFEHSNCASISGSCVASPLKSKNIYADCGEEFESSSISNALPSSKSTCAICLEPLSYSGSKGSSPGQAIFTAQCSHAFHFACIASNVRHGSVTCPICRAHWTQLPRNLHLSPGPTSDPILRILDDSIATFRVHRRSARYDDDDPTDPHTPRLRLSLIPYQPHHYLSIKLASQRPTDLVLVASPNGPHLRLLKQCMALAVFSLRPPDRLAIVTHSSTAARVFPLRRMTSYGKRAALQVIDRLFYMGQADPAEGLTKGVKILGDRAHRNPEAAILHISDTPTRSAPHTPGSAPVHRFHVGFGPGATTGLVVREFEELLGGLLSSGPVQDLQLRVRAGPEQAHGRVVHIGELHGGEERRVLLDLGDDGAHACVEYSYCEADERFVSGESLVGVGDGKSCSSTSSSVGDDVAAVPAGIEGRDVAVCGGRPSSVEGWEYRDPYMARRWAKHLHGYRL